MKNRSLAFFALVVQGTGTTACAQSADAWEFRAAPYAWLSGLSGDVGSKPGLPAGSVDLPFRETRDDPDLAGMLMASARNGPGVICLDTTCVRSASKKNPGTILFDNVKIMSERTTLALAVGRRLSKTSQGHRDTCLGAGNWWLESRFDLTAARDSRGSRTEKACWINPLIGLAGHFQVADRRALFGLREAGGFGIGSDSEWSFLAGTTGQVNDRFGWRHLEVDYNKGSVVFDAAQSGPVSGATFKFRGQVTRGPADA